MLIYMYNIMLHWHT